MSHYDTKLFAAAHKKFLEDATSLTDDDLAQFAIVDPKFAERARAKRAGFVEADDADTKALARPVTHKGLLDFLNDFISPILSTHRHSVQASRELIVALEQRIAALEKKPSVRFRGVFEEGKAYGPGDACTHDGGLWICKAETTGRPNHDFHAWTLAVKSRSIAS